MIDTDKERSLTPHSLKCRLCFRTNQNTEFVEQIQEIPFYNLDIDVYRFNQLNFWLGRKTQLGKIILVYVSVSLII